MRILRCLKLIKEIIDRSEFKGVGGLKSHSCLMKGEVLTLKVTNDVTTTCSYGKDKIPQKIELKLNSNTTIHELKKQIGLKFRCSIEEIKLIRVTTQ